MTIPYDPINNPNLARAWRAIVPSDVAVLDPRPKAIYVGTGGDLVVEDGSGHVETHKNVPSGYPMPLQPLRVRAATTATDLVAWY